MKEILAYEKLSTGNRLLCWSGVDANMTFVKGG